MPARNLYHLELTEDRPQSELAASAGLRLRQPSEDDVGAISELMLDAYQGTIDYHGETLEDAVEEVQAYFEGRSGGAALTELSRLAFQDDQLVAACLCNQWSENGQPLVAFVMTRAAAKNQGFASLVLSEALDDLASAGHKHVYAVITNGNVPSERLFYKKGFSQVSDPIAT